MSACTFLETGFYLRSNNLFLMELRFSFVLWILLFVFGSFYAYGTYIEITNATFFLTKDLWGNLFASMIVVLLIDKIVRRTELQKSERSIRYVKGRIVHTFSNLAIHLRPPSNWQERLNSETLDLDNYYRKILGIRRQALSELDVISDKYVYLIEPKLRNDVFDIMSLLDSWTWVALQEPTRCLADDLWRLYNFSSLTSAIISKSADTIKRHKLLEYTGVSMIFKKGEPPKYEYLSKTDSLLESQYQNYEKSLKEAINLRDASHEKMRKHHTEKKEGGQTGKTLA